MAWTAPMTAVDNTAFTAAQFNTHVRDNLLETMPGKATTVGSYFVSSDANNIVERFSYHDEIATEESTSSSAFTDLATVGPSITFDPGPSFLVFLSVEIRHNSSTTANSHMGMEVSGGISGSPSTGVVAGGVSGPSNPRQLGSVFRIVNVTEGVPTTITAKYRSSSGVANFSNRRIGVINF